jgi:hypothetical protein
MSDKHSIDNPLILTIGHEQLVIRRRYEMISIINDFFIAIWFLLGSVFFLYPSLEKVAIWLFIIGSVQFFIRPTKGLQSLRWTPFGINDECGIYGLVFIEPNDRSKNLSSTTAGKEAFI